jgi:hypothetical protein
MQEIVDFVARLWADLLARPHGPYAFRLVVQPLIALLLALRDGLRDAKTGRSPYFWTVLNDPEKRAARVREAFKATAKVGALALVIDAVYQVKVHDWIYPGEALGIALLLALIPYALIRGPVDRITRRWIARRASSQEAPTQGPPARTT